MDSTSKHLDCMREVCGSWQSHERLLVPQTFGISQWNSLPGLSFLGQACEDGEMILIRLQLAGGEQEVLGQVSIVVGSMSGSLILAMADEKDMGTRID